MVDALMSMGFTSGLAQQALLLCHNNVERAADMLLVNPPPILQAQMGPDPLAELVDMGFDVARARGALEKHGSLEAAINALCEADTSPAPAPASPHPVPPHPAPAPAAPAVAPASAAAPLARRRRRPMPGSPSKRRRVEEPVAVEEPAEELAEDRVEVTENEMQAFTKGLTFGARAFEGSAKRVSASEPGAASVRAADVPGIVLASYPEAARMRGERGQQRVTQMMSNCFTNGLWTFGDSNVPVNREVLPAFRFIMSEMAKLDATNPKRVGIITTLAKACEDCQQVQAREILRIFGDLTAQNETFDEQLKYSLLRQKEAALNCFITKNHKNCDLDHTQVQPHQQRAHLFSGYVHHIGEDFGLDGMQAARADRYLPQVMQELKKRTKTLTKPSLIGALKREMSVAEWLQTLLADINNQNPVAERLINRDCIFRWVQANLSGDAAHLVFYSEDRKEEFKGQDPEEPNDENIFQPFLSRRVLIDMLVRARFLERTSVHEEPGQPESASSRML